ncbi:MAG TPA: hypothetical protein VFQ53_26015 [Kofleriaceae bacterium]|nr:hypothetical protein [Kofleriaceae bacterium]
MSDDDEVRHAVLSIQRGRGFRMLGTGATVAAAAAWWILHGVADQGDPFLIWGPGGVALAIAAAMMIGGIVVLAQPPKL